MTKRCQFDVILYPRDRRHEIDWTSTRGRSIYTMPLRVSVKTCRGERHSLDFVAKGAFDLRPSFDKKAAEEKIWRSVAVLTNENIKADSNIFAVADRLIQTQYQEKTNPNDTLEFALLV